VRPDSGNSAIQVVEATYGLNCIAFKPPPGATNSVKAGNATRMISEVCDKALETCKFFPISASYQMQHPDAKRISR
jgi:hypothetical protein